MPHLEDNLPVNLLLLQQRPETFLPPTRDREEEEESDRIDIREDSELPLPGSLADGIDRVTISASAREIVQALEATVPVPLALVPGENEVNPAAPELLSVFEHDATVVELRNGADGLTPQADLGVGADLSHDSAPGSFAAWPSATLPARG